MTMLQDLKYKLARFMTGRYGMDQFGRFLAGVTFVMLVLGFFSKKAIFTYIVLALIGYMYFRILSKDTAKRYAENQKFLALYSKAALQVGKTKHRLIDMKTHHIYKCPSCGQKIRIPRGKGKIEISCPKCAAKFIKNS